jgi:hypothetical protein
MTNQWVGNIVANNVNSVHSVTPFWKTFYGFLKDINWSNTQILINCDGVPTHLKQTTKKVVFTSYGESPRYPELMLLANSYPEVNFIWLADLDVYDYPLPLNVTFVQYRHWYIWLEYFHDCILLEQIPKVKNKVIDYRFSSLSFKGRQWRALMTAALHTYSKAESFITWHNADAVDLDMHYIETVRNDSRFSSLDWDFLRSVIVFDEWDMKKTPMQCISSYKNPAYEKSAINISNETDSNSWYCTPQGNYTRPGPYLTEKTWKPLITGTVLLNSGQASTYKFLEQQYHLPCSKYNLHMDYDCIINDDFGRFAKLVEEIKRLSLIPLKELVDANIDACQAIQDLVLDPDYVSSLRQFNKTQDYLVSNFLHKDHT